jgi:hypothetical protein
MSEVDKELSERYRAASRDEPPAHVDAAVLAAAKRAVGSQPHPAGAPRSLRRWYVPVSLAAVIMLSVIVTLRIERERPEIGVPDSVPVVREKEQKLAQQAPEAPAAAPVFPPAPVTSRPAPKPASVQRAAPVFVPDPKPARDAAPEERQREDSLRSADAARGPAASGEAAGGNVAGSAASGRMRSGAREMSAPAAKPAQSPVPAKRERAPEEWLERIAELRKLQRDREADEQLAEFRRRYPDYKISETMTERIAPRK